MQSVDVVCHSGCRHSLVSLGNSCRRLDESVEQDADSPFIEEIEHAIILAVYLCSQFTQLAVNLGGVWKIKRRAVFCQQLNICQQSASYVLPQTVQPLLHRQPFQSILVEFEAPTAPLSLLGHADNISKLISICKPETGPAVLQIADSLGSATAKELRVTPEGMLAPRVLPFPHLNAKEDSRWPPEALMSRKPAAGAF